MYIDDMLVKSWQVEHHVAYLKETFQILRKYRMRLNLAKCTFSMSCNKILEVHGFTLQNRSQPIEALDYLGNVTTKDPKGSITLGMVDSYVEQAHC